MISRIIEIFCLISAVKAYTVRNTTLIKNEGNFVNQHSTEICFRQFRTEIISKLLSKFCLKLKLFFVA